MRVECFFDTNVLVYAASAAPEDEHKRNVALDLVRREKFGLSAQVLQEFYVTATRNHLAAVRCTNQRQAMYETAAAPSSDPSRAPP